MDVFEAIRTRRTISQVTPECPPRHVIEEIIEAATWAPNHHRVEPWRFFVLTGEARHAFGAVIADALAEQRTRSDESTHKAFLEAQKARALRAPVIIAVAVEPPSSTTVLESENLQAVAAAIQNLLLAAHARGLGTIWRTGNAAYHPKVKAFFGLQPTDHLAGFIYLGYPAVQPPRASRQPTAHKTHWWGWESGSM